MRGSMPPLPHVFMGQVYLLSALTASQFCILRILLPKFQNSILVRPRHIAVGWVAYLTLRVSLFPFSDINEASCGIYKVLRPL